MRIRITFLVKNKGTYIPFHHQFLISQLLRGLLLSAGNKEYFHYSKYIFSGLKGLTKISRNGLHFHSAKATLVISSPDKNFLDFITEVILKQSVVHIGQLKLEPEHVDEEIKVELAGQQKFICISPIVILEPEFNSEESKRFVEPGTDEFSDLLYDSTIKQMTSHGIVTEKIGNIEQFQLVPDQEYIAKIRESQKKFARIYPMYDQDVKFEVRGYTFPFVLYAPVEVVQFVFQNGLGYFGHKGFGMLDIANSNPIARLVPTEHEAMA